jgi:hypothetical protein
MAGHQNMPRSMAQGNTQENCLTLKPVYILGPILSNFFLPFLLSMFPRCSFLRKNLFFFEIKLSIIMSPVPNMKLHS